MDLGMWLVIGGMSAIVLTILYYFIDGKKRERKRFEKTMNTIIDNRLDYQLANLKKFGNIRYGDDKEDEGNGYRKLNFRKK